MRKTLILLLIVSMTIISFSCRSIGKSGLNSLVKVVSVEQDCPVENIKILESFHKSGGGYYKLEACGKVVRYKKIGSVFMESEKAEKMVDSLSN